MNAIESAKDGAWRRNAQEWAQRLRQFKASGQQTKDFCRDQGFAPSILSPVKVIRQDPTGLRFRPQQ